MLTCITCSKQKTEDDEDDGASRGTPSTKDAVKSLTTQIKDMALKVSGGHKDKPGQAEGGFKKGPKSFPEFDTISEGIPYLQPGSSSSTPAWDYTRTRNPTTRTPGEVTLEEDESKEWTAQVEPGVQITFVSLPRGGNDLKRIRFSREMFNKWEAQRWWGENYDRIMELYNVQKFSQQALNTPGRSEDGRDSTYSRLGSVMESPRITPSLNREWTPRYNSGENVQSGSQQHYGAGGSSGGRGEMSSMEASRTTTDSRDEASVSISNASDVESEWIEEDEPGVYITIRQLADGTRELRRVRFSRERFGEMHAKLWWETNRDRIQSQYLS
ncbi:protein Brevis radix-like 1 [Andrographis paniculata]|uniref:protein Brevis radix-like 1 n=1 Tax=Andrographis paniculata TaxID=175694 RepID=UPI0021E8B269|nr:protein Brevis radix-like 1 [Andrographis paniculata]XP_051151704.1 protein Brevis radix-like 1 [Andrographis paniculata]XP_051151705.1 protein Brevis radix-like 1 [Andrographis paniculata]